MLILSTDRPGGTSPDPPDPGVDPGGVPTVGPALSNVESITCAAVRRGTRTVVGPREGMGVVIRIGLAGNVTVTGNTTPEVRGRVACFLPGLSPDVPPTAMPVTGTTEGAGERDYRIYARAPGLSVEGGIGWLMVRTM